MASAAGDSRTLMYAAKSLGFTANGDVIALANPVRHGFGDGHTPEQVSVGSKTLFPLDRVLALRDD